jgi:hypothetical protein
LKIILQRSLCPGSFTNQHSVTGYLFYNDPYTQVPSQTSTQSEGTYSTTIPTPRFLHKPALSHRVLNLQRYLRPGSFTNQHSVRGYLFYNDPFAQVPSQTNTQSEGIYSTTIPMPRFLHKPTLSHRVLNLQRSLRPGSFTNQQSVTGYLFYNDPYAFTNQNSVTGYLFYNDRYAQVSSQNKGQSRG